MLEQPCATASCCIMEYSILKAALMVRRPYSLWSRALGNVQPCHMLTVWLWETYSSILHSGFIFKVEMVVDLLWGELGLMCS